jgi:hypothetical protein
MFAFYVPPKWIDQDGKGGFTACGEALISIPAKRRNGTLDRAPLTIDVAIKGRTDDGIAVDAIVLV